MSIKELVNIYDPTPLYIIKLFDKFADEDWYSWEPETFRQELGYMPSHRWAVLLSTAAVVNQGRDDENVGVPWIEADVFGDVTQAFAGIDHNIEHWQKPTPGQIWFTLYCMKRINKHRKFSDDVKAYIACCLIEYGLLVSPIYKNDAPSGFDNVMSSLIPTDSVNRSIIDIVSRSYRTKSIRDRIIFEASSSPVDLQIIKMESARIWFENRKTIQKRQISNIGSSLNSSTQ